MRIDIPSRKWSNYDETLEELARLMCEYALSDYPHQVDVYAHYDKDTDTVELDEFVNVGGNSQRRGNCKKIYSSNPYFDQSEYYDDFNEATFWEDMKSDFYSDAEDVLEWYLGIGEEQEHENTIDDIEVGDLVELYNGDRLYICNTDYDSSYFWGTDESSERTNPNALGWSIFKSDIDRIVEKYEEEY